MAQASYNLAEIGQIAQKIAKDANDLKFNLDDLKTYINNNWDEAAHFPKAQEFLDAYNKCASNFNGFVEYINLMSNKLNYTKETVENSTR